jgi:Fe-S-cluster-containing hydrogenase components 1
MSDIKKENLEKGKFYWKSLEEFYRSSSTPEERSNEFMESVSDGFNVNNLSGLSRRKFLALLSASAAFAAASCTPYKDKGVVIPYNKEPVGEIPGVSNYYASTCSGCPNACGILVKTREGRPIKIDGNDEHPVNRGKICVRGQASILNLYDPERIREPLRKKGNGSFVNTSWEEADKSIVNALSRSVSEGKRVAVITNTVTSPSCLQVLKEFIARYPTTSIFSYELFSDENRQNAWRRTYGSGNFPLIAWDKAKVILSIESDFLGTEGNIVEGMRLFTSGRNVSDLKGFNKLYVAEGAMTLTGMNADVRIRIRPDLQFDFVMALLNELVVRHQISRFALDKRVVELLSGYSLSEFAEKASVNLKDVRMLASDLLKYRRSAIVYAGDKLPMDVHIAVNLLNEVIEGTNLYRTDQSTVTNYQLSNEEDWESLISDMDSGRVGVVIHFDSNPVYHLPQGYKYASALKKVETVVTLTQSHTETTQMSNWVLPINHDLESWNDYKTRTGFFSMQQPVIYPLYSTRQKEAVLLVWIDQDTKKFNEDLYHNYLMDRWQNEIYKKLNLAVDFKTFWYSALHDGVVFVDELVSSIPSYKIDAFYNIPKPPRTNGYTLILSQSYVAGDGRFSNNGWLQELPHPVTKVVWDNYVAMSQRTAGTLRVNSNDVIKLSANGREVKLPVLIQPGMADDTVMVELGYGRTNTGTVADEVGVNANVLMNSFKSPSRWIVSNVLLEPTGESYQLVTTMEHHSLDNVLLNEMPFNRGIIREGTLHEYEKNPDFIRKEREGDRPKSIYKKFEYTGIKWAMAIDLNKCTGCSICVISCNAENNIPVVGKDQVSVGREMQWLRIDRYYSGSPDLPRVSLQPMLCQQCDNAPCENVCPVAATTHSPDGLNMMVYNRCVGTRYCSNNCPYKVRRFNFFNFRDHFESGYYNQQPVDMMYNPEVTVRSRGVMEKCTFCIQRIIEAKQEAIQEGRQLKGNDVKTACQQACPAEAITFGDMNDPESEVSKEREHPLGYYVLESLDTVPNVTYKAKLRNT